MKSPLDIYLDKRAVMPLLSWDVFMQFKQYNSSSEKNSEITYLSNLADKFKWNVDVKNILTNNDYEALVLTDESKKIMWVNQGFTKMSGYTKAFAKNKRPTFLQGENSKAKRLEIRKKLATGTPFREVIINYRKDGSCYDCEIYIIPLKNKEITHYLALERAV